MLSNYNIILALFLVFIVFGDINQKKWDKKCCFFEDFHFAKMKIKKIIPKKILKTMCFLKQVINKFIDAVDLLYLLVESY